LSKASIFIQLGCSVISLLQTSETHNLVLIDIFRSYMVLITK